MKFLFIDGTAGHDPNSRKSKPTGGILNSLTLIPEYLASQGHEVYVNSTYNKNEVVNGVHYVQHGENIGKWDVAIFNRNVLPREFIAYCKEIGSKIVWWLHDAVQLTYLQDDTFQYVDKVIALSEYCKKTYSDFYQIPKDKFAVIPNGVDKTLFYPGKPEERNPNLVMMASALIKGYVPVPTVLENLQRHNPDIDFRIYSSQKLHGMENNKAQQEFLDNMERKGAHIYHPVSQEVLACLLRQARCLLMPNSYPEICSNLLLQAQASGCPVVTSNIGANPEFIQNGTTGLYTTRYSPHDMYSWVVEYTNLVLDVWLNNDFFNHVSENAPKDVKTWQEIGEIWNAELAKLCVAELEVLPKN